MDLGAAFNRLVQMVGADMKKAGEQIAGLANNVQQIVTEVTRLGQRLTALEQRAGQPNGQVYGPGPGNHPNSPKTVNGEVVADGSKLFNGDPEAFYKGDDDA